MPDDLRKVRSGDPLRLPARAYNAFVDAAVDLRRRQGRGDAVAGPLVDSAQRGNVLGQASRQLTVTFGSGGPGAMRFRFAEANATVKKAA